jgi:hypothetical protein
MVSFRKWIPALTGLAIFTGMASAQVVTNQLQCSTNVSVTPTLRSEGFTEQTGDITLTCTGGAALQPGSIIPQVNVQIFLNTAVTSRLLPISGITNSASEALLLIDEPGSGLPAPVPGFGPAAPQLVCGSGGTFGSINIAGSTVSTTAGDPTKGCAAVVGTTGNALGQAVIGCTTAAGGVCTTASTTPAANIYQGIVSGNSVTFFGIPVLPPVTAGTSRVFRITNIRANATSLSGGSAAGATPVIASISISGATSLLISNPTPTVGFVQSGLSTSVGTAVSLNQCTSSTRSALALLTFSENFGTAFKTRVAAMTNSTYAGQINNPTQNVPGTIYNSESNFVTTVPLSTGTAGLADYGTRLKAVFNNVPSGVRLFVSTANVNNAAVPVTPPAVIGGSAANTAAGPTFAQLVSSETVSDGNAGVSGFFPAVPSTDTSSTGNTPIVEIPVVNGSATAVWEVVNTNPNQVESLRFGVYATFTSNVAQNSPTPGTGTVNLSFAPTPPVAFTAASAAAASSTLTIPRFVADPNPPKNLFTINICRTVLLYPYVTNIQGFDTGLAIANTSTDPFGTGAQSGSCTLNWFQGTNNPAQGNTGNIASGTVFTTLASTAVPGFNGYMIAVCNFQFAHGFAFISDLGARNLAMGYLALVIPDPSTTSGRGANPLSSGPNGSGENIGH